jgi:hypothetical protein
MGDVKQPGARILYCHCAYAEVVPADVKREVLDRLAASGQAFDAVPDLCELSARHDPALKELGSGPLKIVACYPRAVRWLFAAAEAPLAQEGVQILNMRTESAESVVGRLVAEEEEQS